jgi:hypothetical protein
VEVAPLSAPPAEVVVVDARGAGAGSGQLFSRSCTLAGNFDHTDAGSSEEDNSSLNDVKVGASAGYPAYCESLRSASLNGTRASNASYAQLQ